MKKQIELLAPAGSFESLQAAINAGANAVYFGVEQLNMRTRSANSFSVKDIQEISRICKANNVHAYITLNTVMYEHDMQLLKTILKEVKKQKIDAVIAADIAVMEYCRQMNIPLHVSTQANVSNIESVKFFSSFADVIVLARELTLGQVKSICSEIKRKKIKGPSGNLMKIELFVHGALCMAISGKCYLSLHTHNASANRGACVQNCRRSYLVKDAESGEELLIDNEYIMSPKDLCTIDILDQVIDSGVDVLKIEGRTKGPEYVQVVTNCYREAVEAVNNGTYSPEKIATWKTELEKVYNRGFWEGYYLGRKSGEWASQSGSAATEKKVYIGKATKYYSKIKVGEFLIESGNIKTGDTLLATGRHFGMIKEKMETLWVNGNEAGEAIKGDKITFPLKEKLMPGDKLYKIVNA
ncbi:MULTISPECIES: peptidase U32 family protein [Niastella]|uniref:U32 family peptidase n=1 Tax=Niastella soli TaxID=2821487 RepID=A0ABS3YX82_9BACT|nr:peptidase U32 family protein [Niastella soli]MBO9202522.1 U32 family peptidase [Niastella soli]